jgi:hypothetical protein
MALTKSQIAKYVTGKTGLSECVIRSIIDFTPHARNFLQSQLNNVLNSARYEIRKAIFDSVTSGTAATRVRAVMDSLDVYLEKFDRVYRIVPWTSISENCPDFADILDMLKSHTNKVPGVSIASFDIPGLKGVNSYDALRNRKRELSYKLQQLVNKQTYAGIVNTRLQTTIDKAQAWINAMDLIDGLSGSAFVFSGGIFLYGNFGIRWADSTLSYEGSDYTIEAGNIPILDLGVHYIYYDTNGSLTALQATTGEYASRSGGKVRIAKVTITGVMNDNTFVTYGVIYWG